MQTSITKGQTKDDKAFSNYYIRHGGIVIGIIGFGHIDTEQLSLMSAHYMLSDWDGLEFDDIKEARAFIKSLTLANGKAI